ncbi:TPA: porin, partial [Shigella flexneri]|nr:porin [Shigella flexneri]
MSGDSGGQSTGYKDSDRLNYIEIGTWYYFNKNMNIYTAYQINLLD